MGDGSGQLILVIGQGRLVEVARRALDDAGAQVRFLRDSTDRQIRRAMSPDVDAVMVICRDDRASLRRALVIEAVRDVYRIRGALLAAATLGSPAEEAFISGDTVWVIGPSGRIEPVDAHLETAARDVHVAESAGRQRRSGE